MPDDVRTGYLLLGAVIAVVAVLFTALMREQKLPVATPVPWGASSRHSAPP
ncbi:hypothetical protein [Streptomyces sp. RKAG290]|uniref:hypothetical protein n=1 Tax=Streptomyces sp. RKAG290 TaxID=2888348 RepID=UPI00203339BC|nr:hypothetical protein [Streptomyces sp. RKAG290]MCM2416493.1 hypothetical protein [Streptomyces sp. RKAG290]